MTRMAHPQRSERLQVALYAAFVLCMFVLIVAVAGVA